MKYYLQVFRAAARITVQDYLTQPLLPFWLTLTPFVFALVAMLMYQNAPPETLSVYVLLGSGATGMWAGALGGVYESVRAERWWRTLQYTFTTPAPSLWIAAGKSLVYTLMGLCVWLEVLIVIFLIFGVKLTIASAWGFGLAAAVTILAFAAIGVLLSSFFMLTRAADHWHNALSRFLYVFCGALYPIGVLPEWSRPISYALAPTWSLDALRCSVTSATLDTARILLDSGLALLLIAAYLVMAWSIQRLVDRRLRVTAGLERF
jgi:ABC-2 type transport system permease protein